MSAKSDLIFISSRETRQTLFPGKAIDEIPHEPEEMLRWTSAPETSPRMASLRLRYLVMLNGSWGTTQGKFEGGASMVVGMASYGWKRFSIIRATVLDLAHRRNAGELSASAWGEVKGGIFIFFAVLPIPVFEATDPKGPTCTALGEGLAAFITEETSGTVQHR